VNVFGSNKVKGTLGGAALATDPAPNTVGLSGDDVRVGTLSIPVGGTVTIGQWAQGAAGNLSATLWVFDSEAKAWFPLVKATLDQTAAALTLASGGLNGARVFQQVTANGGGLTQCGWFVR
jgi:hypothetical protein